MLLARNAVGYGAYFRSHGLRALSAVASEFFSYFLPHKCCGPDFKAAGAAMSALVMHSVNRGYMMLDKVRIAILPRFDAANS